MKKMRGARVILTTPVEHHAVLHTVEQLAEEFGFSLSFLPVDRYGAVNPLDLQKSLSPEVALVSVIAANNEIGTINPIGELGRICRQSGILFHTDAVQAAAHDHQDVQRDQIDLLALGAHKFYGPKGTGVLYVRKGIPILPTITGGGQESGRRSGTHNVANIIGLAEAFYITQVELEKWRVKTITLRNRLIDRVLNEIPGSFLTGHPDARLPNHASFVFEGVNGNNLLTMLDMAGFACSSGSACKTGDPQPSGVLLALGIPPRLALGSLRVTLGRKSTNEHVDSFLAVLPRLIQQARNGAVQV
jgi:cysteine desulfurase